MMMGNIGSRVVMFVVRFVTFCYQEILHAVIFVKCMIWWRFAHNRYQLRDAYLACKFNDAWRDARGRHEIFGDTSRFNDAWRDTRRRREGFQRLRLD